MLHSALNLENMANTDEKLINISKKILSYLRGDDSIQDITAWVHYEMSVKSKVGEKKRVRDLVSIVKYWRQSFPDLDIFPGEWPEWLMTILFKWYWFAKGISRGRIYGY